MDRIKLAELLTMLLDKHPIPAEPLEKPWIFWDEEGEWPELEGISVKATRFSPSAGVNTILLAVLSEDAPLDMAFTTVFARQGAPVGRNNIRRATDGDTREWFTNVVDLPAEGDIKLVLKPQRLAFETCLDNVDRFVYYANQALAGQYIDLARAEKPEEKTVQVVGDSMVSVEANIYTSLREASFVLITHPDFPRKLAIRAINSTGQVVRSAPLSKGVAFEGHYDFKEAIRLRFELSATTS